MKNDPKIHLDDLAEKLATGKDLPRKRKSESQPRPQDRRATIYVASFIVALLILFALGLIVLFVRR